MIYQDNCSNCRWNMRHDTGPCAKHKDFKMTQSNKTDKELDKAADEYSRQTAPALQTDYHKIKHIESFKAGAAYGEARAWKSVIAWLRPLNSTSDHLSGESIASVLEAEIKKKDII